MIKRVLISTIDNELELGSNKVRPDTTRTPVYNNRTSRGLSGRLTEKRLRY
jgi:hypothetical protein